MEVRRRIVEHYTDPHGRCYFEEWLDSLAVPTRARIIARLIQAGNGLLGDVAPIGEGASEMRLHFGPGYRIYAGIRSAVIVVLAGSDKSAQRRTIEIALLLWREYKRRVQ